MPPAFEDHSMDPIYPKIGRKNLRYLLMLFTCGAALLWAGTRISSKHRTLQGFCNVAGTLVTGIVGSMLATVHFNDLLSRRLMGLPFKTILEALSERTKFIRKKHRLILEFRLKGRSVEVRKIHRYQLCNPGPALKHTVAMYTDSLSWNNKGATGGFESIVIGGSRFAGESLKNEVSLGNDGKRHFSKECDFPANGTIDFEFTSKESYRLKDRLIWTVEDLSDDFDITMNVHAFGAEKLRVKINHHRSDRINPYKEKAEDVDHATGTKFEVLHFAFGSEILPYQGFEIMWDLES